MRIKFSLLMVFICASLSTSPCFSQDEVVRNIRVFQSFAGEQLAIINYGEFTDNNRLIYFSNFDHAWNNKVLLHHYNDSSINKTYKLTKKTGNKFRPYAHFTSITDSGDSTLYKGSIVPVINVYLPQRSQTIKMHQVSQGKYSANEIIDKYNTEKFEAKW